jgi:hypothetical protein
VDRGLITTSALQNKKLMLEVQSFIQLGKIMQLLLEPNTSVSRTVASDQRVPQYICFKISY